MFGGSIRASLLTAERTRWNQDELTCGTYSAPLPGHGHARTALARPVDDRLHFAGEATSIHWCGDVHGAYQSGLEVAEKILLKLAEGPVGRRS